MSEKQRKNGFRYFGMNQRNYDRLEILAKRYGVNKNEVIDMAFNSLVKEDEKESFDVIRKRFHDLLKDLNGPKLTLEDLDPAEAYL